MCFTCQWKAIDLHFINTYYGAIIEVGLLFSPFTTLVCGPYCPTLKRRRSGAQREGIELRLGSMTSKLTLLLLYHTDHISVERTGLRTIS